MLAIIIMTFMQLTPGVFALFYHYAIGKMELKKASNLALFFILGVEIVAACMYLSAFYLTYVFFLGGTGLADGILAWVMAGVMVALGAASLTLYYRKGKGTMLFIPRWYAEALDQNARTVKTRTEAFLLGAFAGTAELVFTLPLYILTSIEIMRMEGGMALNDILTVIYILAPTFSLFLIHLRFYLGYNLADMMKMRVKDKPFVRVILTLSYLTIAALLICYRIGGR